MKNISFFKVLIDGKLDTLTLSHTNEANNQYNTSGNKSAFTFLKGKGPEIWPKNKPVKTSGHVFIILD